MIITFNRLLQKYRNAAFSKEDLGRRFERLMLAYADRPEIYRPFLKNMVMERFLCKERFRRS